LSLVEAVRNLMRELNVPMTLREARVDEEHLDRVISKLADDAFEDQCTTANPRMPLVSEIEELIRKAF
jgi:acetaldehyde dehydrogenase/alcohol dehydrogenase